MPQKSRGSILVSILVVMIFLTTFVFSFLVLANSNLYRARSRVFLLQAQYAAESGVDQAIAHLNSGNESYTGSGATDVTLLTNGTLYKATYSVSVAAGADAKERIITATGKVYVPANSTSPNFVRTIQVDAQRTSTTTAASMLSRNIIEAGSSVKDLKAKDIFANGYIRLGSNVNRLVAENIMVAGRDTSAGNCSIGGTGSLIKPASFSDQSQTKTNITTAYNNCISPPGNLSNTNFTVLSNQTSVGRIQSTFIPWSQFMDTTYTAAGNCNDWSAANPIIPSSAKASHYPDSSTNVAPSCGSTGSINLDTKTVTITDNIHVRANLCSSAICRPTFNNTSGSLKFIFVEGSINFEQLVTAAGSAPIVFVAYGADPGTHAACPIGDAIYLGQQGNNNTNAPKAYFLANNGICMDKTKFGAAPALGGAAGKNIYIATNSGTPFDLSMDITFPTSSIPIDLSWKATHYLRK